MPLNRLENFIKNIEGRILYVNPNDLDSTDSISNDGNSLAQPFKTIQRALIESARFSYVTGRNNDRIERTTILVYPGEHVIDNRPGFAIKPSTLNASVATAVAPNGAETTPAQDVFSLNLESNFDLTQEDNILYKFNSVNGGVIVPRGTSLVGLDLRKTKIRPKYVPNPTIDTIPHSALFRITGTCYFWQFSIFDGDRNGTVYTDNKNFTNQNNLVTPLFSHHKLTCFEYADGVNNVSGYDNTDLEMYYDKLSNAFVESAASKVIPPADRFPTNPDGFAPRRPEFEIVGAFAADPIKIIAIQSGDGTGAPISQLITVTTSGEHNLNVGTPVQIKGVTQNNLTNVPYNTSSFVQEVVSSTVFRYLAKGDFTNVDPISGNDLSVSNAFVVVETDTVSGASPYIFNCSLRSVYGMNGMIADGAKATGFRSMVVAQFTGISLQKDDRAFAKYNKVTRDYDSVTLSEDVGANLVSNGAQSDSSKIYHLDSDAVYRKGFETCHITMKNDAILQIVSVFAIGYAKHFSAESGGDASVTNSNSNFGQISLNSDGFKKEAFTKDDTAYITSLITPKAVTSTTGNIDWFKIDVNLTGSVGVENHLYLSGFTDPDDAPPSLTAGFRVGAALTETLYIPCGDDPANIETKTAEVRMINGFTGVGNTIADGINVSVKRYEVTAGPTNNILTIGTHGLQDGEKIRIISDDGDLPENIEENSVYFAIVVNTTQIKLASSKTDADNNEPISIYGGTKLSIESRVHDKESGDVGSPIFYDTANSNWCINVDSSPSRLSYFIGTSITNSNSTFIQRKTDTRSLDDKIYKLRVVVPKEVVNGKNPEESFILQESSNTGYQSNSDASDTSITSADHSFNRNLRFISSASVSNTVVTVDTSLPHNLNVNEKVVIKNVKSTTNTTGIGNSGYNGTFIVTGKPTNKQFTYATTDVDGIEHSVGTFTAGQLDTRDINLPRFERNDILSNFYIYRNETIEPYIEGQQDGIYHLFVLNASNNVTEEFTHLNYSQNVVDLYPQLDRDNLNDNPPASVSFAKRSPLGDVATNSLKNSLTRETNDKILKDFGVGLKINTVGTDTNEAELTFDREHNFGSLVEGTISGSMSGYTDGTHYDVKILDTQPIPTGANWNGATANVTVSTNVITNVVIVASGSNYTAGTYYFDETSTLGNGNGAEYIVTSGGIRGNIGDVVQVTGIGTETDTYSKITEVNTTTKISIAKTSGDPLPKSGQFLIPLGSPVVISGTPSFDSTTGITTFTTSSAHGLKKGNSFRILDSSNNNLGDFIVKDRNNVTEFTSITTNQLTSPSIVIKHGMSANDATSNNTNENLSVRGLSFYDGDVLRLKSSVSNDAGVNTIEVEVPNSGIGTMARFPLGSYIQVDNEIMRVSSSTLSGSSNDELTVIRGVLGSDKENHDANSLIKKIKPLPVEFRRPSIIRASGHTFEYVGYGPGNYSTGLPQVQVKTLTEREEFLVQSQERSCGAVVYTGMNNRGDFFIGNKRVSSTTGQERTFDAPIPTVTGEDPARLSVIFDEVICKERILVEGGKSNQILSQFDGPVTFNNDVKINADLFVTGTVKFTGPLEFVNSSTEFKSSVLFKANAKFQDNKKILLGDGADATDTSTGDCEVYHDSSNTIIDQIGTGDLILKHSGQNRIEVNDSGTVLSGVTTISTLKSDATILTGITTTGIITATSTDASEPAITATNTGGNPTGGILQRWVGDDHSLQLENEGEDQPSGSYQIVNTATNNGIVFYDNEGGVRILYNGEMRLDVGFFDSNDVVRVGDPDPNKTDVDLLVTGDITAFHGQSSDERLKDNIKPIDNPLEKVMKISGNTFSWNEKSKHSGDDIGVIAQEVEELDLPEIVTTRQDGYKTVKYEKLVPLLIEAIKELKNEIDELKNNR